MLRPKRETITYDVQRLDAVDVAALKEAAGWRVALIAPSFNEADAIGKVAAGVPRNFIDEVIVVDDGSTDGSMTAVTDSGATVLARDRRSGIGSAIRYGLSYVAERGFDAVVIIAGNGKDDPAQVGRLLAPLLIDAADYVQGSRYLKGGAFGRMPMHRRLVTRVYPLLLSILTGRSVSDGTNGYRAYRLDIMQRADINLSQDWLDECLEYYVSVKVNLSDLKVAEVPVSKFYPDTTEYNKYTKVRVSKLYKRLLPLLYLVTGLRR